MGDCTKKAKRIAGTVEEEMKEEEEGSSKTSLLSKRTKFTSQQLEDSEKNDVPSADNDLENDHLSVKTARSSAFLSAPCSSSNDSLQVVKDSLSFADLELELRSQHNKFRVYLRQVSSFETDNATSNNNFRFTCREASPLREICVVSQKASMNSLAKRPQASRRRIPLEVTVSAARMPSLAEIDEFFAATEKNEQKRFAEKYNYDIAKDVPLEGRYQWIQLKP